MEELKNPSTRVILAPRFPGAFLAYIFDEGNGNGTDIRLVVEVLFSPELFTGQGVGTALMDCAVLEAAAARAVVVNSTAARAAVAPHI